MKTYKLFNINNNVTVILTEAGAKFLNKVNKSTNKEYKTHLKCDYEAGQTYKSQLWALFKLFNNQIGPEFEIPFLDCIIGIDPKNLHNGELEKNEEIN